MGKKLIGHTAYWRLSISDFCKVYDIYVYNQPAAQMSVRPSKDGNDLVVTIVMDCAQQVAFFFAAMLEVSRPPKEGVDYVLY